MSGFANVNKEGDRGRLLYNTLNNITYYFMSSTRVRTDEPCISERSAPV